MELPNPDLSTLFAQLGLDNDPASIDAFIAEHYPLPDDVKVTEAPFWSKAQRTLLKDEMMGDGDWALVVDELNVRLHASAK